LLESVRQVDRNRYVFVELRPINGNPPGVRCTYHVTPDGVPYRETTGFDAIRGEEITRFDYMARWRD